MYIQQYNFILLSDRHILLKQVIKFPEVVKYAGCRQFMNYLQNLEETIQIIFFPYENNCLSSQFYKKIIRCLLRIKVYCASRIFFFFIFVFQQQDFAGVIK